LLLGLFLSSLAQTDTDADPADVQVYAMPPRYCDSDGECTYVDSNKKYPLNMGNPLIYNGGKIFTAIKVYTVFYGGMRYWDSNTAGVFIPPMAALPGSKYMAMPRALALTKFPSQTVTSGKQILYYGRPNLSNLNQHLKKIGYLLNDPTVTEFGAGVEGSFYMIILDPEYSKPSNFKISNTISFDSSESGFCGYHGAYTHKVTTTDAKGKKTDKYVDHPYTFIGTGGKACSWYLPPNTGTPNANFTDVTLSVYAHELGEMITDPLNNGFYDNEGYEYGDKCAGSLGGFNYISGTSGPIYNVVLGTKKYLFQARYSYLLDSCPPGIYTN